MTSLFYIEKDNKKFYSFFDSRGLIIELPTIYARHLLGLVNISYSEKTVKEYLNCIKHFLDWIENSSDYKNLSIDNTLKCLSRKDFEDWIKSQEVSINTKKHREVIVGINFFQKFLSTEDGLYSIDENFSPYKTGKLISKGSSTSNIPKFITENQLILLLKGYHSEAERCAIHTAFDLGLRVSELCRLKKKDLPDLRFFPEGLKYYPITVSGSKGRAGQIKKRISIISSPVLVRIQRYHQSPQYRFSTGWSEKDLDKPLFLSIGQMELTEDNVYRQMKRAARRAGLNPDSFYPHALRHGCAYSILASDLAKDSHTKRALLQSNFGHSRLQASEPYSPVIISILNNLNQEQKFIDKYEEAKRIFDSTFLSPIKHLKHRGRRIH